MRLAPGLQLGPYEVVAALGSGGMAEVYRARDTRLGREVALKVVNESLVTNPDLVRRFEQEARLAGSLNHPNLVAVFDVGHHEGSPFLVTELLQGESLRKRLSKGPVPLKIALDWAGQLARGLAAAHARGVVHRDVKPDNIFVGTGGLVKLLDFGIAKLSEVGPIGTPRGLMDATETPTGGATRTGAMLGTPGYMSPEQLRGESVDARSDVFSLGAVIYEMLSGHRPFQGSLVESGYAILHHEPAPLSDGLPPMLVQIVNRCLDKAPARRFQSASDLAFDLELLRDPTTTGRRKLPGLRQSLTRRKARWTAAAAGLLLLVAIGLSRSVSRAPVVVSAVPSQVEQITHRWGWVGVSRFMPDGRIAVSAAFEDAPEEVFTRPPGMSAMQPLGLGPARLASVSRTGEIAVLLKPAIASQALRRGTLARLPNVGGAPREVAEDVEFADWSPAGELAVVIPDEAERRLESPPGKLPGEAERRLESPPGKVLFRTGGWIVAPRFSGKGEQIAFLHRPPEGGDQLMVVDLEGRSRVVVGDLPRGNLFLLHHGLAWTPGDSEIWFTVDTPQRNAVMATDLAGSTREVYRSLPTIRLDDIAADGRVLLTHLNYRTDGVYLDYVRGTRKSIAWTRWHVLGAVSDEGKVLLSVDPVTSADGNVGQAGWTSSRAKDAIVVVLRKVDGNFTQVLGEGRALDLTRDGRWALVKSAEGKLTILPTGAGQSRIVPTVDLELADARWFPDGKRIVALASTAKAVGNRVYLLAGGDAPPKLVSDSRIRSWKVFVSPDGGTVAGQAEDGTAVLISVADGSVSRLSGEAAHGVPRGWSPEGDLWVTLGGWEQPARARLLRVDVRRGRVLEERTVSPADLTGTGPMGNVLVTPDGKGVVFGYARMFAETYIVRGLLPVTTSSSDR